MNCRQAGPHRARDVGVIETRHRKLRRHRDSHLVRRHQHACSHVVIARENRGRRLRHRQQLARAFETRFEHELPGFHVVRTERQLVGPQRRLVPLQAPPARVVIGVADDESDALMSEADQVVGHLTRGALVVDVDIRRAVSDLIRRDAHERQRAAVERFDELGRFAQRRRHDEPVGMRLVEQSHDLARQFLALFRALVHEELEALLAATRHRAVLYVHDVVGAGILVDQRDEIGAASRQPAGRHARVVVQLLDDGLDARAGLVPDVRLVIEHARNGFDRNAGRPGDIVDGFSSHSWP
jgi:hypothetical protein